MTLPLDNGYLRRECPACKRQFKWHNGPVDDKDSTSDGVSVEQYFCPYCGQNAHTDSWWTDEQLQQARELATGESVKMINDSMKMLEHKIHGGLVSFTANSMPVHESHPLYEPEDMTIVQSPCHPDEPIKVASDWHEAIHCLLCGKRFAVQ